MTSGKDDEEFFKARGFGLKMGFGDRPALIVIDLVKAFTDDKRPLGANLDPQVAATQELLTAAHARGFPVLFSTVRYDDKDLADAGIWVLKQKGSVTLSRDTDGSEIDPRLPVGPSDSILLKKYASCFFGTDLVARLVSRRVDTLVIAGCTTSGCVRATAVDAVQNGFRPMIVQEAVGDRSKAAHDQSLFDLNAKYGDVVSLADTVQYFKTVGHNTDAPRNS
jgi:maleamate amidohydrolase